MTKAQLIEKYGVQWYEDYLLKQKVYMYNKKQNETPEQREKRLESQRKYYKKNASRISEITAKPENRERARQRSKKWYEEHKEYAKQRNQDYIKKHPDVKQKSQRNYRTNHQDRIIEYNTSKIGRAGNLARAYKQRDVNRFNVELNITTQWIIDNIFNSKCYYCGESDWHKLGCDRIDNSKPHTPDNVVPCCGNCNTKRGVKSFEDFCKSMGVKYE